MSTQSRCTVTQAEAADLIKRAEARGYRKGLLKAAEICRNKEVVGMFGPIPNSGEAFAQAIKAEVNKQEKGTT